MRLGSGTVVLPRRVRAEDGTVYPAHREWRAVIADALRGELAVDDGDLLSVAEPLVTPAAKSAAAAFGVVAAGVDVRGGRRFGAALAVAVRPLQWRALWILAKRYRAASRALERAAALTAASRVLVAPVAAGRAS